VCVCVCECVSVAVQLVSEQVQGSLRKLHLQVSSGGVYFNYYFRYCFRFYREIILHLIVFVPLQIRNLSKVVIIPYSLVIWRFSILSSIELMERLLSNNCSENLDFPFPCL